MFTAKQTGRAVASLGQRRNMANLVSNTSKITKGIGRLLGDDVMMVSGKGSYVELNDGRKMLDFSTGIGVTGLGHCHPKVSSAAAEQCMTLVHGQCSIAAHPKYLELIERITPHLPHPSLDTFFWWNSGSEAVEAAIKMARTATGKQGIISMQGAYHGRTYGAMSVTKSKTIYSQGVGPLMPSTFATPFPYWHHHHGPLCRPDASIEELTSISLEALELLLKQQTAPSDTAAIIIEPVLGEGGYVSAPPAYLQGLRDICDRNNILLIIDEVQSGFGRTGSFWAVQESGVRPDILLTAKGLANGFPLSGVITNKAISESLKVGSMGGTYGGNAVSCAAACAVIETIEEQKILQNVNARSAQLFKTLNALKADPQLSKSILDVRGKGLMVGVEFDSPSNKLASGSSKDAIEGIAGKVAKKCIDKGLLILTTSVYETIRFIPTLNITEEEMAEGCKIFEEATKEVLL